IDPESRQLILQRGEPAVGDLLDTAPRLSSEEGGIGSAFPLQQGRRQCLRQLAARLAGQYSGGHGQVDHRHRRAPSHHGNAEGITIVIISARYACARGALAAPCWNIRARTGGGVDTWCPASTPWGNRCPSESVTPATGHIL